MTETQLLLNDQERNLLRDLLTLALKERLVEEHRTRTPLYREHIRNDELVIQSMLDKLNQAAVAH